MLGSCSGGGSVARGGRGGGAGGGGAMLLVLLLTFPHTLRSDIFLFKGNIYVSVRPPHAAIMDHGHQPGCQAVRSEN